jgi:hypothetical protein
MPEIARFSGIIIRMYYDDRHRPHFHAYFAEYAAIFSIDPLALYGGFLPRRQYNIVLTWAELYQRELLENWERARNGDLPLRIEGRI